MTAVPPGRWTEALARRALPEFDPSRYPRLVVLAAHPDDETLGAGGAVRVAHRAGARITVVVATDGEAAYPGLGSADRRDLARTRRRELHDAMATGGLGEVSVRWLGLPDSGLADRDEELVGELTPLLADADAYLAPWTGDPHPDHRAVGHAAAAAAPATTYGWGYPVWMWPWMQPEDSAIHWDRAYLLRLSDADLAAKRRARDCFVSQIVDAPSGAAPVLSADMLAHSDRAAELMFREPRTTSAPLGRFASLYAERGDPWRTDSWYERRKRAVVLACLPRERYRRAVEPGCGNGELTVELAPRCDRLTATEPVHLAAERARRTTSNLTGVQVTEEALPSGIPEEVDLAVFSEVLYYLDDTTVNRTLDETLRALLPGGDLVLVSWRGWPSEAPRDEAATAALVTARPELEQIVEHTDREFVVRVLRRR
ncbi:bifunctional PIG-L family deacetylase/class I SAM-dependent methyltransferase [Pseudonocardia spinosispora]|uniref:bifunctional PIG-L family deacetylase/class I SAM-dependent methyltransferase n=1 Tax=Pseudonocardia spinosispora TaxID=103441 RepID=UPI0003F5A5E8|nr:bifunctional PIG-L family deacetylase/class I SAM-dependent methyltransferase [Pseudonocardia spinosispora]